MLPAAELTALQNAWATLCDTTATVQRNANLGTPNTDANWQNVSGLVNIKCLLGTPTGGNQLMLAAALVDQSVWIVSFPATNTLGGATDVRRSDRISVAGLTLTVQHVLAPQSYSFNQQVMASAPR